MTNTIPTTKILKGTALKNLRRTCKHERTITLGDGIEVCTACEWVGARFR